MSLFPPDGLRCLEAHAWTRGRDDFRFGLPQPTGGDLYHPRHKVHYLAGYAAAKAHAASEQPPLTDRQIANLLEAAKVPPERQTKALPDALPPSLRPLWDHMAKTHGLALTSSELYDIQAAAKVQPEPPTLADHLKTYREAFVVLGDIKRTVFSPGTAVEVNHTRYKGPGKIVPSLFIPDDMVAVLLPNDNIWWYPMESVHVAPTP